MAPGPRTQVNGAPQYPAAALVEFLKSEAAGGTILMVVAALALVVSNSPASSYYFDALHLYVGGLSVLHWINDGLMAAFFLLVGLEIKRELLDGELSTWPQRVLPGVAAAAGMLVPALIYVALNSGSPETLRGWAVPAATDIAFALGVISLLGQRVPVSLKIFLTALAILDDLGAVAIIAVFYTAELSFTALGLAALAFIVLAALNYFGVTRLLPYLALGLVLWFLFLKSGVHATLSGVVLALTIPSKPSRDGLSDPDSPLHRLEHALHPYVVFFVMPVFGFANAGVSLAGVGLAQLLHPVTAGTAAGLFFGKQFGIFAIVRLTVALGWAERPRDASWPQVYGVSLLCGIGFTMSLFIGLLAFPEQPALEDAVKVGVLLGSLASAVLGAIVLLVARPQAQQEV
jgi:Na+:H+ antiporter, NhaA family